MITRKNIGKTAALVLVAALLSGCGAETKVSESSKQPVKNETEETVNEKVSERKQQPYDEVLQQFYRDIVNRNFSFDDGSQYFRVDSLDEFGYTFLDLNDDGIDELFFGSIDNMREHNFFKMYILEDGKAKELLSTGNWYSYSLCEDGYIAEYESSMATRYYQLEDGLVEKEFYDAPFDRRHPPLSMKYTPFRTLENE